MLHEQGTEWLFWCFQFFQHQIHPWGKNKFRRSYNAGHFNTGISQVPSQAYVHNMDWSSRSKKIKKNELTVLYHKNRSAISAWIIASRRECSHPASYSCRPYLWWRRYEGASHASSCLCTSLRSPPCRWADTYMGLLPHRRAQSMSETVIYTCHSSQKAHSFQADWLIFLTYSL